jgi:hypothetical protein
MFMKCLHYISSVFEALRQSELHTVIELSPMFSINHVIAVIMSHIFVTHSISYAPSLLLALFHKFI